MAPQTTSNLTSSIISRYFETYMQTMYRNRLYDQIAMDYTQVGNDGKTMAELMRGSSVVRVAISEMEPGTTAISEVADVTPQTLRDTTVSVTPTSRGEALLWSEKLEMQAFDAYTNEAYQKVAENASESIELVALNAATQGSWVQRAAARASLDAGTSGNRASDSLFGEYQTRLASLKVPGFVNDADMQEWVAIMHPAPFHDIRESGNVDSIGLYQDAGIHLNFELGKIGPFRLVVSPWAKVFWCAGADEGTSAVAGTLASAANALATSIVTSDDHSAAISYGDLWLVGTEETSSTNYPKNEVVKILSASTTTLTIAGEGPNGGLRFDHDAAESVLNNDHVYTIIFGGPMSLVKLYATDVGPYGQVVGPKVDGLLDQFNTLGWKWYGAYGRPVEKMILRHECTSSFDA